MSKLYNPDKKGKYPDRRSKRRAPWHDYCSKCIYMITIAKNPEIGNFASIVSLDNGPVISASNESGKMIEKAISTLKSQFSEEMSIYWNVIMPDHIHFIIYIKKNTGIPLWKYVNRLKTLSSLGIWRMLEEKGISEHDKKPTFERGFHDRILMHKGQLDAMKKYIMDNPRRLLYRRHHPDLYRESFRFRFGDEIYRTIGNIHLLDDIEKIPVKISRKWDDLEYARAKESWMRKASQGSVIISPFFNKKEKEILWEAMAINARIIYILEHSYDEKSHPQGKLFDYCATGQILFIMPDDDNLKKVKIDYAFCHHLNDLAAYIAATDPRRLALTRIP